VVGTTLGGAVVVTADGVDGVDGADVDVVPAVVCAEPDVHDVSTDAARITTVPEITPERIRPP
jgi:hypothetical protein